MAEVRVEVIMHFPERTHSIKGYLETLDLNHDHTLMDVSAGYGSRKIPIAPTTTSFILRGRIANWEDKGGRDKAPVAGAGPLQREAAHARRAARRERARSRRRRAGAAAQVHGNGTQGRDGVAR